MVGGGRGWGEGMEEQEGGGCDSGGQTRSSGRHVFPLSHYRVGGLLTPSAATLRHVWDSEEDLMNSPSFTTATILVSDCSLYLLSATVLVRGAVSLVYRAFGLALSLGVFRSCSPCWGL